MGNTPQPNDRLIVDQTRRAVESALGPSTFTTLHAQGRRLKITAAIRA